MENNRQLPLLIVDDEAESRSSLSRLLDSKGWTDISLCGSGPDALAFLNRNETGIVILDLNMPGMDGFETLRQIAGTYPEVPVIIVTGIAEIDKAVECMKAGAYDFFTKPARADALDMAVRRAMEKRMTTLELRRLGNKLLSTGLEHPEAFSAVITNSPPMFRLFRYIEAVSKSPEPVLIQGESGTGKELLAAALHSVSGLSGEFVTVNLAGLDDAFFSDTLFGHRKGAFTGAQENRSGLVEKARGGTLFMDEIGDLDTPSQVKLLRLLQEGDYYQLGSDIPRKANIRICAATHRNIESMSTTGKFRADLFFRLSAHRMVIPPLRERKEDIPLLAAYFLDEAAIRLGRAVPELNQTCLELLNDYDYPGNVRELRALIYDACCVSQGKEISADILASRIHKEIPQKQTTAHSALIQPEPQTTASTNSVSAQSPAAPENETVIFPGALPSLKAVTELLVDEALRRTGGNQARAAALIGVSHQALSKRLKKQS